MPSATRTQAPAVIPLPQVSGDLDPPAEVAALGRHDQLVPGVASLGPGSRQVRAIES